MALIVTELFRLCSLAAPLWTTVGTAETGMAGVTLGRPFTGGTVEGLPLCGARAEEPTTTGGLTPPAITPGFFDAPAAEAYDGAAVEEEFGAEIWFC